MKKVLLLTVFSLASAAFAAPPGPPLPPAPTANTTVSQPVAASVSNVCIVLDNNNDLTGPGKKETAAGLQSNNATPTMSYKANADSNPVNTTGDGLVPSKVGGLYAFRCTSGTQFTATVGKTVVTNGLTGNITLSSQSKNTSVTADYTLTTQDVMNGGSFNGVSNISGDVHAADASFVIKAGQWSAKAADDYKGVLSVSVNFN